MAIGTRGPASTSRLLLIERNFPIGQMIKRFVVGKKITIRKFLTRGTGIAGREEGYGKKGVVQEEALNARKAVSLPEELETATA